MNKVYKVILTFIFTLGTSVFGLALYAMTGMSAFTLIQCSSGEGGIYIPSSVCEFYLKDYRLNQDDIEELSVGGLDPILNLDNEIFKYELATVLINKGLDVNGINFYYADEKIDLTPLHAAIIEQDVKRTQFLIESGAKMDLTSNSLGNKTPLQYAHVLNQEQQTDELNTIIKLLTP